MAEKKAGMDKSVNIPNTLSSRLNNPTSLGSSSKRRNDRKTLKPRMNKSTSAPAIGLGGNKFKRKNITFKKNTKVNNFLGNDNNNSNDKNSYIDNETKYGGSKDNGTTSATLAPPPSPSTLDHLEKSKLLLEIKTLSTSRTDNSKRSGTNQPLAVSPLARKHSRIPTFTESLNLDRTALTEFLNGNFLYMKPIKDAQSVYDLGVVDHTAVNMDDYHTMSRAGITHFTLNSEPEFTPL